MGVTAGAPPSPIPRRSLGPGGPGLSLLGVTVLPPPVPGPTGDRSAIERLRHVRSRGVTTFDVAGSPDPRWSERLLREAFPDRDEEITVIVGRRTEDLIRREGSHGPAQNSGDGAGERLEWTLDESRRRLMPQRLGVVEWTEPDLPPTLNARFGPSGGAKPPGSFGCRRLQAGVTVLPIVGGRSPNLSLFSGPLSLLDPRLIPTLESGFERGPLAFLAREPFAGGRLDGTRAAGTGVERGPGSGPVRLRDLQEEFGPVLALGFITGPGRRTLAQAAIQFAARWPWTASVLVPLPTADRLAEILDALERPPLSDEELRRVLPSSAAALHVGR